jgi:hypothetical protein
MLSKSVHNDNNILPKMEFGIQLYETFPNTNPDVPTSTPFK